MPKEKPGCLNQFPVSTELAYDATEEHGNQYAGVGRAVTLNGSSGLLELANHRDLVLGVLVSVSPQGQGTVMTSGEEVVLRQSSISGAVIGSPIIGGAQHSSEDGYVQSPSTGATFSADISRELRHARGCVLRVISNTAGGEIVVRL